MRHLKFPSRFGPAFIVGACIIGPGSVTIMSRAGSLYGYSLLWLALWSGVLMAGFLMLFMRFGVYSEETFLGITAKRMGRWFAVLCGVSLASTDVAFGFGVNLAFAAGMATLWEGFPKFIWPIFFTVIGIAFLFSFKGIYLALEKMMKFFLFLMLIAFLVSLAWARPDVEGAFKGLLIPGVPEGADWITLGGIVGTTFALVVPLFQSYLVKAKGWGEGDLASGIIDAVFASILFTLIGCLIMMTGAAVLYPDKTVESAAGMAVQLEGVFGVYAKIIFCIGFLAASFSSFITNALIGGVLLNDGLGMGGKLDSMPTKIFATFVMLIGMIATLAIIAVEPPPAQLPTTSAAEVRAGAEEDAQTSTAEEAKSQIEVKAIAVVQGAAMLAVPFGTIAMVVVLFDKRAVKGRGLSLPAKGFVLFGAAVLLGLAVMMYVKIKPEFVEMFGLG